LTALFITFIPQLYPQPANKLEKKSRDKKIKRTIDISEISNYYLAASIYRKNPIFPV